MTPSFRKRPPSGSGGTGIKTEESGMGLSEGDRPFAGRLGRRKTARLSAGVRSRGRRSPSVALGLRGRLPSVRPPSARPVYVTCVLRAAPEDLPAGRGGDPRALRAWSAPPAQAATPRLRSACAGLVNDVDRCRRPRASAPEASALWAGVGCPWGARLSKQPAFAALTRVRAAKPTSPVETRRGHK